MLDPERNRDATIELERNQDATIELTWKAAAKSGRTIEQTVELIVTRLTVAGKTILSVPKEEWTVELFKSPASKPGDEAGAYFLAGVGRGSIILYCGSTGRLILRYRNHVVKICNLDRTEGIQEFHRMCREAKITPFCVTVAKATPPSDEQPLGTDELIESRFIRILGSYEAGKGDTRQQANNARQHAVCTGDIPANV